ncbi:hypothetical protein [Gordonia neofelifaecis]|uniref:Mce-associated membrane protein n=1 Tax=Gordonia neofelifaecis NRRL B-59395 TaxID=644548 RepID=F1YII8_9ACTN|nr:hypothetical protein [Gordonia neofelifaecis]EGD55296.1 hypothetical protein SCNU_08551 [Gordonia neofelifaecis NRRL B-59395]
MASGRTNKSGSGSSKRTPKVAGRGAPRVSVSKPADADTAVPVEDTVEAAATPVSGVERKRRVAAQKAAESEAAAAEQATGPGPRDTGSTFRLAAILGAVAVVVGVIATVLAFHPGADVNDNRAFVDQAETDQVLAQARAGACAPFQFDYQKLDKWADSTRETFTGGALDQFETFLKTNRNVIEQTKTASECQIEAMGVSDLEDDHATVVGTLVVSTSRDGVIAASDTPHVQYTMAKTEDGDWKISEVGQF